MRILLAALVSTMLGCPASPAPLLRADQLPTTEQATVLVTAADNDLRGLEQLREQAQGLGLSVEGQRVLRVQGAVSQLRLLHDLPEYDVSAFPDENIAMVPDPSGGTVDRAVLTLAQEEFGLTSFWQDHPEADGRGVVVGVIDDGVSPNLAGLQETTTGQRKYLNHHGSSSSFTKVVTEGEEEDALARSYREGGEQYDQFWEARISERHETPGLKIPPVNLNGNRSTNDTYEIRVFESFTGDAALTNSPVICVDLDNNDRLVVGKECMGDFGLTGQYQYWDINDRTLPLMAHYDEEFQEVTLYPGEDVHDDHGEGVASVLTGYQPSTQFSGIAPGAQFADYDIGAPSFDPSDKNYTIGAFLQGLEWMGLQGVEVVNISYNFYFFSAASQLFMATAIDDIMYFYNMVVAFSAGNHGPALGSFRRGLIYPPDALVAGAFASQAPSEMIFGVTGLPEEGRILRYSSRGPGPDGGSAPTVVAPVAAMAASPDGGYRPFAGTSSAAPAVAGLAAVLLSHIKAERLEVNAAAISHAIRLSGRPVPGVPYVAQGTGLPQIKRAVTVYKAIMEGAMFQRIEAKLPGVTVAARAPAAGLLIKASDHTRNTEFKVLYTGLPAATVNPLERPGMLQIYRVETNVPWLHAPAQLAVSTHDTSAYISIDESLLADVPAGGEAFGEVRLINEEQEVVVHTVPVTYVNDKSVVDLPLRATVELGSAEGRRRHFFVPLGVQGLLVEGEVLTGPAEAILFDVVDAQVNPLGGPRPGGGPIFVPVNGPGWYQATVARKGGSPVAAEVAVSIDAVQLRIIGAAVVEGSSSLLLENHGAELDFRLELRPEPLLAAEAIQLADLDESVAQEFSLDQEGPLEVRVGTLSGRPISAWRFSCVFVKYDGDGQLQQREWVSSEDLALSKGLRLDVGTRDVGGRLLLECESFERTDEQVAPDAGQLVWHFELLRPFPDSAVLATAAARLPSGQMTDVNLDWEDPSSHSNAEQVGVYLRPMVEGTNSLRLGALTLVESGY